MPEDTTGRGADGRVTNVTIFGREYTLSSREDPEYTRRISGFVDRKMGEIASEKNMADPAKLAILTAMEIADLLLRYRGQRDREEGRAVEALRRLEQYLDTEV